MKNISVNFLLKLPKCDYSAKELHSPVCTVHKSPATQYITPRELVVTHLIALSPSKFLFYVLHCFHLRTELPWKYPQQIRITILFRNSKNPSKTRQKIHTINIYDIYHRNKKKHIIHKSPDFGYANLGF